MKRHPIADKIAGSIGILYHVFHRLPKNKDYKKDKKEKRITAPILKLTYDQKPETFLGGLKHLQ